MSTSPAAVAVPAPALWRVFLAFLIAPGSVLAFLAGISHVVTSGSTQPGAQSAQFIFIAALIFYAYPSALLIGFPAWMWARRKPWFDEFGYIVIGAISAVAPLVILAAYVGATILPETHVLEFIFILFGVALFVALPASIIGAGSGLVFLLVLTIGAKPPLARDPDPA